MPNSEDIKDQLQILALGRHTVSLLLLKLIGYGGRHNTPAGTLASFNEICARVRTAKATLRGWGVQVDDHPNDDADGELSAGAPSRQRRPERSQPASKLSDFQEGKMSKKILLIDNDPRYLSSLGDYLEAVGYQVARAESIERARELLEAKWVHVLLIDMRLRDDNDGKDLSGLTLAKDPALRGVPKIILTRYPSVAAVREALGAALNGIPPAVDYIDKRDQNLQPLLDAIESALGGQERINFELQISFDPDAAFAALVSQLLPQQLATAQLLERSAELEDLMRKLCCDSQQITIGRLLARDAGRLLLEVFAYNAAGIVRQYVVSCGLKPAIAEESRRYRELAPQATGNQNVIRDLAAETLHFAASAYMLNGADLEQISTFREFYQSRSLELVATAVDQLYQQTLASWHQRGRSQSSEQTLADLLRELEPDAAGLTNAPALGQQIAALGQSMFTAGLVGALPELTPQQITLRFPSGQSVQIANPARVDLAQTEPRFTSLRGTVHGRVDADTILVDASGRSWLIDFARAGHGLLLYDFVALETTIKFELLDTLDAELRYRYEQLLAGSSAEPVDGRDLPAELQRAQLVIERIRANAQRVGAQMATYQAGLFGCALRYLVRYQPERHYPRRRLMPFVQALLQAGTLTPLLSSTVPSAASDLPKQVRLQLWLDQINQVAWVEGRRVDLTTQEFQILAFLSQHAGRLCTRQEIADGVLGIEYDMAEESRLNSAISRLRLKLEPDPAKPRYLITVRGRGYRLAAG